jgi:FKBP-type peptidyl-prolyl cis-trans isomerase SlyD
MSSPIAEGKVVGIYYTLKNDAGEVLDTNRKGGKPLAYLHGAGNILPGLERALLGKVKNDDVEVHLEAADAYGEVNPEAVRQVPRASFPAHAEIVPGMRFTGQDASGRQVPVAVQSIEGDQVTVDHNHPLAGQRLHFSVTVVGVRDATDEERQHGHPHGPGGHAH